MSRSVYYIVHKNGAQPLFLVGSCCWIFSFLCNVLQIVVSPFPFGHCVGCPFSDSDYPICIFKLFVPFTIVFPQASQRLELIRTWSLHLYQIQSPLHNDNLHSLEFFLNFSPLHSMLMFEPQGSDPVDHWVFICAYMNLHVMIRTIVLSILRFTDSDYPFGIFKLFL